MTLSPLVTQHLKISHTKYQKNSNQTPTNNTLPLHRSEHQQIPKRKRSTRKSIRHRLAWTTHTRPEILVEVNILSQVTRNNLLQENIKITFTLLKHLNKYPKLLLQYKKLEIYSLKIVLCTDGSFSGNNY